MFVLFVRTDFYGEDLAGVFDTAEAAEAAKVKALALFPESNPYKDAWVVETVVNKLNTEIFEDM